MRTLIISKHIAGGLNGDFYYSGEWVRTFDLSKALASKGMGVSLITPKPAPQHRRRFWEEFGKILGEHQIRHYLAPTFLHLGNHGGSFRLRMAIGELRALLKERPDIIMYMQFGPSLLHKIPYRPPIVYTSCHFPPNYGGQDVDRAAKIDWSPPNGSERQLRIEDRIFYSLGRRWGVLDVPSMCLRSEAIVLWHPSGYEELKAMMPAARNFFFIPKGVDLQASRGASCSQKKYDALFAGVIMERKGIRTLLEAFQLVNRELPEAKLAIAGTGPAPFVKSMLSFIRECRLNAEFLGSVPFHDRWSLFYQSSVFCLPSLCDTYPTVILEAMACGLPVITTLAVDTRVEDGISGFLVPPKDPKALAEKVLFLLKNPLIGRKLGEEGKVVAERYDWNLIADQIIEKVIGPLALNRRDKR